MNQVTDGAVCRVCKREFPVTTFYRDATKPSGRMTICPECYKASRKQFRVEGKHKTSSLKYRSDPRNQIKLLARQAVQAAVKNGTLYKPQCCQFGIATKFEGIHWPVGTEFTNCENTDIEAHHYLGYSQQHWTTIIWLCPLHHALMGE